MNSGIDLLRHLLAVCVITQHMTSISRYSLTTNQELALAVDWIDGAVIGFFLISGFLFKSPENISIYFKKQAIRLLIPFFIFSTIYAVILAALGKRDLQNGLMETIMLNGAGMQLYYLPYLLFVTTTFAIIQTYINKRRTMLLCVLAIIAVFLTLLLPTQSSTGAEDRLIPYY